MHRSDSGVFDLAYEPLAGTSGTEDERAEEGRGWWKKQSEQAQLGTLLAPRSGQTSGAASPVGSAAISRSRQNSPRSSKKAAKAAGAPRESRARRAPGGGGSCIAQCCRQSCCAGLALVLRGGALGTRGTQGSLPA